MIDTAVCIADASASYNIHQERIKAVIAHGLPAGGADGDRVGVMGVPVAWLPLFQNAGISAEQIRDDPCQNIIVGTWIMAYQDQIVAWQNRSYSKDAGLYQKLSVKRAQWRTTVSEASRATGISEALIHAVITAESRYNPRAISPKGAIGMMQLMPKTAAMLGVNPYDPVQNIYGGAKYLGGLIKQFDGNIQLAVASYNAGPTAVIRHGYKVPAFRETQAYVVNVLGY